MTSLSRGRAAAIGLIAAGSALAAGHLVAGFGDPRTSPPVAVGGAFIDLVPPGVKEFAVALFGTADKIALLTGMAVVIAALAVAAGLLSRNRVLPGALIIGAFGLVGLAAALSRPEGAALPAVVSLIVGVGVFAGLHRLGSRPEPTEFERRRFLATSGLVVVGAGLAGVAGTTKQSGTATSQQQVAARLPKLPAPAIPAGADFVADGTPPFLTPTRDFYRIDTALVVPRLRAEDWRLRLHGMVERELDLSFTDLLNRRLESRTITLACVSNEVGGNLISTAHFVGVPVCDLLLEAGVRPGAQQLITTSSDGYSAGTPVDVLLEADRGALLAFEMNGEPLATRHGFPVRMVVPGLYGYVSATKWLVDAEVTTFDRQAYWQQRGWSQLGPIKTQSRIDRPQRGAQVPAGPVTVAGIAWAQHTGIDAVQIRVDGGPWQPAELATDVGRDTWRMWRARLDLAPGEHVVQCRATDRTGTPQTEARQGVIPDGATGLHEITFRCG
ncbi:molybdopterin-dependent oxidoreductase [Saccharopolyspora flava]|uniref:DMSO/TMAO reductase YedYZ, molybdopterin-dependent catalytic subunit n=1 Tax=Saccharopolyspora flava TaxID=95161 RepID=A0A1I6TIV7_9PSEU|nr:molybdopterin-dependent oxidoreductase [Saccharopolyspora flava]SFS89110.1 DMSO/TMAO reductase YedYZ, molybdopterin-dependent catalytic subunit [Saccharopolyspora flava]